jgi:hypothetical protein
MHNDLEDIMERLLEIVEEVLYLEDQIGNSDLIDRLVKELEEEYDI